jgi:amino acid adenylation domain-containing protein
MTSAMNPTQPQSPPQSPQPKNVADLYPLSPMQQGMLFHTLLSPDDEIYLPQIDLTLEGDLDPDRLHQAWQQVIAHHPALRTAFQWEKRDQPFQVVYRQVSLPWQLLDWSTENLNDIDLIDRLNQQLDRDRHAFELKAAPLMRLTLVRISSTCHHLIWTQHHLILDGWSAGLVLKDVFSVYSEDTLSPRPPYRDYIAWLTKQDYQAAQDFWKKYLAGFTEPTVLPCSRSPQSVPTWDEQEVRLSPQITTALRSLSQQHQLTLNTVIQGTLSILLSRYTDRPDICFGATQSGRSFPGSESMIGLFINTLPVRVQVPDNQLFISWLQQLQTQQVEALQYDYSALMDIQTWSEISPGTPLFETLLVFENYPIDPTLTQTNRPLRLTHARPIEWNSVPLTLLVAAAETLTLKVKFDRHRFPSDAIARLLNHFQTLLQSIITQPSAPICDLSLLSAVEQQQLQTWNQTTAPYPQHCLPDLFEAQVEKTPDAIALIFADQQLTYRELNHRANQLAHLLQSQPPQEIIGICADRSPEMIIGLLAILKTGAAYLPLDPTLPLDRLTFMVEDAQIKTLLTPFPLASQFPSVACLPIHSPTYLPIYNPRRSLTLDSPISVLYTSGSTGVPKGVINTHRGIVNRLHWMQIEYQLTSTDRILQKTPYSFDVSIWEFFWTLLNGACLVIAQPDGHKDSAYLVDTIAQQQITTLHFVPSMLQAFLESPDLSRCTSIRRVICSGEALPTALAQQFHTHFNAELHNLYGPTEAAIDVTAFPVPPQGHSSVTIPIGHPIANTQIYILDRHRHPVPIGVPGELYIGGVGLAQGYLNRPELTAERFISSPFPASPRLYRTGDRARYLPDGAIEFLGRLDDQIKLRGLRIELGEIEAALLRHPQIQSAAVILDQSTHPQIVAYIAPRDAQADLAAVLPEFLRSFLPEYIIPSTFITLEALPLLSNGKLDRRSLPHPSRIPSPVLSPRNATEAIIADIWKEVLHLDRLSVTDRFFDLGGNSLLATRINSRLHQAFQIDLPLRTLFEQPTVAALAATIATPQPQRSTPPILPAPRDYLPLSFAQQRLWFLEQLQGGAYHIPVAVQLTGELEIETLERSLNALIDRHESLRTNFQITNGEPVQIIHPDRPLSLPLTDLQSCTEQTAAVEQQAIALAQTPFNLATDPLLRVHLLRLAPTQHVILLTLHHIITDGWSMEILLRELANLYESFSRRSLPSLPALPIQYADFALWQRQWLQGEVLETQLTYWKQQLGGTLPVLQLPTDFPRARVQTFRGAIANFSLPLPLSQRLQTLSQTAGTTLFTTLLTAYKVLLHRYTGQTDIIVGTPIANRHYPEVEGLIGFFVNTLVLRTDLSGNPGFNDLLQRVQENIWNAYDHQDLPFEKLVEVLHPERDLSYNPLFQVKFRLENPPTETFTVPGLTLTSLTRATPTAKLDLSLDLYETPTGLMGAFEYNCDLFNADTIDRLIAHFSTLLEAIVHHPNQPINTLPLLTAAELQQRSRWNATETTTDPRLFHQIFEQHAVQTPDAIALIYETQHLTYAELNRRANQLAHHLIATGVRPETLVALSIDRTPEMIIGLLAILKSGGAYLPLDPAYPGDRLSFMLTDSQAVLLLTHSTSPPQPTNLPTLTLDTDWKTFAHQPTHNPTSPVTSDNLAYLIYTSGSTGNPKGVLVSHAGLVNLTEDKIRVCQVRPHHCILQFFSLSFDASIPEIIMALGSGAKLCLAPRTALQPGDPLLHLLRQQSVTHMTITPSALSVLPPADLPALEMVLVGGEAPSTELMQRWSEGRLFINAYGPTETTVNASMVPCGNGHPLQPTLAPSANKQLHILDEHLQPLPIGAIGELYIGGLGLARGYHSRPDLTAAQFIPDPFRPNSCLYKTGDLATFLPDGRIKLLGRMDHQVKIRGFRIEPGEIEMHLTQHPQVQSALVIVRQDDPTNALDKRLVAYIVPAPTTAPIPQDLRRHLKAYLPDYMVPTAYVLLNALPLTPNGKVDQRALPAPDPRSHTPLIQPRTPIEEKLVDIFKNVLDIESISIQDDFFELGGHSLLATRLIAQTLQFFQIELTVADLFEAPTIAELSDRITTKTLQSPPPETTPDREEIEF